MKIPEYITRQQLTDAFAAMGLDASEVLAFSGHGHDQWLDLTMRPKDAPPAVEYMAVKIPIAFKSPAPPADLIGELERTGDSAEREGGQ